MIGLGRRYSLDPLADLVTGTADEEDAIRDRPELALTDARLEALERWSKDPWSFLTGTDPDTNLPIIRTIDQRSKEPIRAYPSHLAYCHFLIELLETGHHIQVEKASQMIVTTTIALWALWRTVFQTAHKTLLSKHKQEEAETILDEKVRQPWLLMPDWLRVALPITLKPKSRITAAKTGGIILGLPENAAAADARGQTYQLGLIDEAEFQAALRELLTAMLPRARQVVFWSTPGTSGEGVRVFGEYLKNDPIRAHPELVELKKKYAHVRGMSIRRNEEKNITIVRIEHTADPSKRSKAWEEKLAASFPSMADFRREMKIDRTSQAGKAFYPAFAENPQRYIRKAPGLIDAPIVRGWDAGRRNPAFIAGQWSKRSRRFWVLRELSPNDCDMYAFRDIVKFLCGQLSYESLAAHDTPSGTNRAYEIIREIAADKSYPAPPWFEGANAFIDLGGHEFVRPGPGLTKAGEPQVAAEILALGDIYIQPPYTFKRSRYEIIRALAKVRSDGLPGLMIDPACSMLIRGLCGEIVWAKGTEKNPEPNEPQENRYSHLHDALGYALVNTVALDHADYFAATQDGELPAVDLDEEEHEFLDSYLTGGW